MHSYSPIKSLTYYLSSDLWSIFDDHDMIVRLEIISVQY